MKYLVTTSDLSLDKVFNKLADAKAYAKSLPVMAQVMKDGWDEVYYNGK